MHERPLRTLLSAVRILLAALTLFVLASPAWAQFSGAVQGTISDPSGAAVPGATVILTDTGTQQARAAKSDRSGNYRFVSLPPGSYTVSVEGLGFEKNLTPFTLQTQENRAVPVQLRLASTSSSVEVSTEAPTLNTAETRQQLTLDNKTLRDLPLSGNSVFTLLTLAPGVTGTNPRTNNYNPEYFSGVSANGRSAYGNTFNIDGVSTNSNITNGTTNVLINPDAVQEVSIQTDTFTADQGRGTSIQTALTTKSGSNRFHGSGNYLFTNQDLLAKQSLPSVTKYAPFAYQDYAGTLGGPVWRNRTFFFASVDQLASKTSSSNVQTYESPEFVAFAAQKFPNTQETQLLQKYPIQGPVTTNVLSTAQDIAPNDCGPTSTTGIPCALPVLVQGTFNTSPYRNGQQYLFRGDQILGTRDRLYGNYTHSENSGNNIVPRPAFNTSNTYMTNTFQADWTHTFKASLLNEVSFSGNNLKGVQSTGGLYRIPLITIRNTNGMGQGGSNVFVQHNYTLRNSLIWTYGKHTFKFGGDYFWANDTSVDPQENNRPNYLFNNILDYVQGNIFSGGYGAYDPLTGSPKLFQYGAGLNTVDLFAQDEWRVTPNLNLTFSIRWDDFGNAHGILGLKTTNVITAPGTTVDQQFSNAVVRQTGSNEFPGRIDNNFSPRFGFAYSPGNRQTTSIHGGVGLYEDWITLGEVVDRVQNNPPNYVFNNFGIQAPIQPPSAIQLGTSDSYPFGFSLPQLGTTALNASGGILGLQSGVGGLDPHLHPPRSVNYILGVEQLLPGKLVFGLSYNGSHTFGGLDATDFNRIAGDLVVHPTLQRINPNFGGITYTLNNDPITYNALVASVKRDFGAQGTIQGSYTLGKTTDCYDGGQRSVTFENVADPRHLCARRADSNFDIRNRVSASGVYRFKTPLASHLVARQTLGGWELGSTYVWQTGAPYGTYTPNSFDPIRDSTGKVIGMQPDSGDYNADGFGEDYPNQSPNAPSKFNRSRFVHANYGKAVYTYSGAAAQNGADFWQPAPGFEGNGNRGYLREQPFLEMDASLIKNIPFEIKSQSLNIQLKAELLNVLNRVNLGTITNNVTDPNFGKILSQGLAPRTIQVGGHLSF